MGKKKPFERIMMRRPSGTMVSVDLDLPITDWSCDVTAAKLTELLQRPYKGQPLTGKELMDL